ncbi:MAG TPA: winged helix-turn-helix domain-containing protein [Candidatus Paceibacterota bacterium]
MAIGILAKKRKRNLKTSRQLERHFKGVANYHRVDILLLVAKNEGITVDGIARSLQGNFKTISDHTSKLAQAGLVNKAHQGARVVHSLSPYGKLFVRFINEL